MNRFIIVDGLPFLYANGKAYAVRWDDKGFTVGAEVEIASVPTNTFSELSIKAKCAGHLDSIQGKEPVQENPSNETQENQDTEPEQVEADNQETPEEQDAEPEQDETSINLEDLKLDELKEYAANNGISLNGARTKATIIEAIRSAKG